MNLQDACVDRGVTREGVTEAQGLSRARCRGGLRERQRRTRDGGNRRAGRNIRAGDQLTHLQTRRARQGRDRRAVQGRRRRVTILTVDYHRAAAVEREAIGARQEAVDG